MTPLEIAALEIAALAGALGTLGVIRLRGKAPPNGDRLRPPLPPPSRPSER